MFMRACKCGLRVALGYKLEDIAHCSEFPQDVKMPESSLWQCEEALGPRKQSYIRR